MPYRTRGGPKAPAAYAAKTAVPVDRSRAEIERMLLRHGAGQFALQHDAKRGLTRLSFSAEHRVIRFELAIPPPEQYDRDDRGKALSGARAKAAWEQDTRQRWRCLALVVKAKLEAIAAGVETFEQAFLAHVVMPDGSTLGEWAAPQLAAAYEGGKMPSSFPLLPKGGAR